MTENMTGRQQVIVKTSIIGIMANLVLVAFKAVTGLLTRSIAITLDAVNNLSDALSSVVTILGAKIAGKAPDREHPLGHGRVEYMSQLIVAAIVLYAGLTSLIESGKKIIHPEAAEYSTASLIVVVAAIGVKIVLGRYVKRKGEEAHSGTLVDAGEDALFDAILSASVLVSAIIFLLTGVSLEAYVGAVISVFIIKSGIEMIRDAVNEMIGVRIEGDLTKSIRETVEADPDVQGAYDLLLHNYGPDHYLGSIHVEVDDGMTAREIDTMTRRIQENVYAKHHIILDTIGIYSRNTGSDRAMEVRTKVTETVLAHPGVLQIHGFYFDEEKKDIRFDVILDFAGPDRKELYEHIVNDIREMYPGYTVRVTLDVDVSD